MSFLSYFGMINLAISLSKAIDKTRRLMYIVLSNEQRKISKCNGGVYRKNTMYGITLPDYLPLNILIV